MSECGKDAEMYDRFCGPQFKALFRQGEEARKENQEANKDLAKRIAELHTILNGNGKQGILTRQALAEQRLDRLDRKWIWVITTLTTLAVAVLGRLAYSFFA